MTPLGFEPENDILILYFSTEEGANPTIGEVGKLEAVEEERIETVCSEEVLKAVLDAIKTVHPYQEPATDVYPIEVIE